MSFAETVIAPSSPIDHAARMIALLDGMEARVRRRFLRLVRDGSALADLEAIAALIEVGAIEEATLLLAGDIGSSLSTAIEQAYVAAGLSSAEVLRSQVDTLFDFNQANARAVNDLQLTRLRLVREFNVEQVRATNVFLQDAFRRGLAPIEQARALKDSIGLTQYQARIIQNYRGNLERRSIRALQRELRDRRFDSVVQRAIDTDIPLTTAQIDRMVKRYRERWLAFRAQTIAETETLRAASAADEELWRQAIEEGVLPAEALINTWRTSLRATRRPSHIFMEGQVRPFGVAFRSGDGNNLRYPSDPSAPASDTIRCQCVVAREIDQEVMAGRAGFQPFAVRRLRAA